MPRTMFALISTQGTAMGETALCLNCHADPIERKITVDAARIPHGGLPVDWNGGAFRDCTGNDQLTCQACGFQDQGIAPSDHSPEPRGYTYKAENYCPEHIVEVCISAGELSPAAREMGAAAALAQHAEASGVDWDRHYSYDSDDFPKPFSRFSTEESTCGTCGATI